MPNFPQQSQFLIYKTEDGRIKIDVRFEDESVWLTQQMIADLFQTSKQNVSYHIKSVFEEGELSSETTVKKILTVQQEGARQVQRQLEYYNLDMIISVGYRIKSHVATRFRIWATQQLREFIVKGFVLDDERLKNPELPFDYFEELSSVASKISEPRSAVSTKKLPTFTPPVLITIPPPRKASPFSKPFKTNCIGL